MNQAERRRNEKRKRLGRKQPITKDVVVGMLDSSARLDALAADKQREEAKEFGRSMKEHVDMDGKSYEVINISGGYSIGIMLSAQILAGQAAELALKFAYEAENPNQAAPKSHELSGLYERLSQDRKDKIEKDYAIRIQRRESLPSDGWQTVEQVFRSGKDYPVHFRYLAEEGRTLPYTQPIFFREAVCSVLASLGTNIRWGTGPAGKPAKKS